MIDFDSNKSIIVYYPQASGGKFLINCLGVSNQCLLQSLEISQKQIFNNFTSDYKKSLLLEKLSKEKNHWTDLGLGCIDFYQIEYINSLNVDSKKVKNILNQNKKLVDVLNSNNYHFKVAHDLKFIKHYLEIWPNSQIIEFTNFHDFCIEYRKNMYNYEKLRGSNWPKEFPTYQEFLTLPKEIKNDISNHYDYFSLRNFYLQIQEKIIFKWNTDWYFQKQSTLDGINQVYNALNLKDIDKKFLENYYSNWITKIKEIQ